MLVRKFLEDKRILWVLCFSMVLFLSSCATTSSAPKTTTNPKSNSTSQGLTIVKSAKKYIGTKYKYGGIDSKGMDCSGLVYAVFKENGITLPRTSTEQSKKGTAVYIGELQAGDLIFFGGKSGSKKIVHAGIVSYSDGKIVKFIHASSSKGVREDDVAGYWRPYYIKARRIIQ